MRTPRPRLALGLALLALGLAGCKQRAAKDQQPVDPPPTPTRAAPAARDAPSAPTSPSRAVARPRARPVASSPAAVKLLDAAIAAHGGLAALRKQLGAWSAQSKGTFYGQPYTSRTHWQAPDKHVMEITSSKMTMGYVGTECWNTAHRLVMDCEPVEKKTAQEMLRIAHWSMLYGLKEPGISLRVGKAMRLGGRALVGLVATTADGSFRASLHFDARTKLLARMAYDGHWSGGERGPLVTVIGAYRKQAGVQVPVRSVTSFRGKPIISETVLGYTLGKVDARVFRRPAQVPFDQPMAGPAEAMTVAYVVHVGPYEQLQAAVGRLMGFVGKLRLAPMGRPLFSYVKMDKDPRQNVTHVMLPVVPPKMKVPAAEAAGVRVLGATTIVYSYVKGPYDKLGPSYGKLMAFIKKNGYRVSGPPMMMTYSDPAKVKPADLINQVLFPVKK